MKKLFVIFALIFCITGCYDVEVLDYQELPEAKEEIYEEEEPESLPPKYDIPIPDELQKHIWDLCEENKIAYELVLAVIFAESEYNIEAKNVNKNGSKDRGLMQINSRFQNGHAENAGVEEFDPYNPYQNIIVGVNILVTERDYWRDKGCCDEDVYSYTLGSFHYGREGVRKYGLPVNYINKITKYKEFLEDGCLTNGEESGKIIGARY